MRFDKLDSLEPPVVMFWGEKGREEIADVAHDVHHRHVNVTEQWPPLIQHLLCALQREVAVVNKCDNNSRV